MTDPQQLEVQVLTPTSTQVVEADAGTPEGHVHQAIVTRDIQLRVENLAAALTSVVADVSALQQTIANLATTLDELHAQTDATNRSITLVSGVTIGNAVEQILDKVCTM